MDHYIDNNFNCFISWINVQNSNVSEQIAENKLLSCVLPETTLNIVGFKPPSEDILELQINQE